MRIIITGGSGLIGRQLTADLAQAGYQVVVLSRNPARVQGMPPEVDVVQWDARTAEGWGVLAEGARAIVNLAGENLAGTGFIPKRWTPERKDRILQSRLRAGEAVVQAVETAGQRPAVVVQSSGIGYYGHRGDEVLTEASPPGSDWLAQLAVQWEAVTAPVEGMGVRRVVIRTAGVFSDEGGVLPRTALPFRLFVGGPMGNGRQWVPWIHIEDEARAIRFLIESKRAAGPFNLVAPEVVTNRELSRVLGQVLHRPAFVPLPGFLLRLAFGEMADLLLKGQRAVPQRLEELGFSFRFGELRATLHDLLGEKPREK